jgi:putative ABC transport system permease protein
MRLTAGITNNLYSPVWVVRDTVLHSSNLESIPEDQLSIVRSVDGVDWAQPLSYKLLYARTDRDIKYRIQLLGLDDVTLGGVSAPLIEGSWEDLKEPDSVVIDDYALSQLVSEIGEPLKVGSTLVVAGKRVRVVGIVWAERTIFSFPFLFTSATNFHRITGGEMKGSIEAIMVNPKPGGLPKLRAYLKKYTSLKALEHDQFFWKSIFWHLFNTGFAFGFISIILVSWVVGIVITAQVFFGFIMNNRPLLGALKAIGMGPQELAKMTYIQAVFTGIQGFGIGLGSSLLIGMFSIRYRDLPFLFSWQLLFLAIIMLAISIALSARLAVGKIEKIDPVEAFK